MFTDKDAMLRTIKEAVKEGLLVLPTVKWDEINSVRFISNVERSVEITSQVFLFFLTVIFFQKLFNVLCFFK